MMRKKPGQLLAYATFALMGALLACGRTQLPEDLIPAECSVVVWLDWRTISNDADLLRILNAEEAEASLKELDISSHEITTWTIFAASVYESETGAYQGVILSGELEAHQVVQELEEAGCEQEKYQGDALVRSRTGDEWFVALNNRMLAVGTDGALQAVLDVKRGRKEGLSHQPIYTRLDTCLSATGAPIRMWVLVPQHIRDMGMAGLEMGKAALDLMSLDFIGGLLGKIGIAQGLGLSIAHSGSVFPAQLMAMMKNEEAASFIAGSLNLMKGIGTWLSHKTGAPERQTTGVDFRDMTVKRYREVVEVGMRLSHDDLFGTL